MTGDREVFFEYVSVAGLLKVSAIDAATGTEVSVFGPASAARRDLERLALRKLQAALLRADKP
jgi:hypothetical protein